MDRRHWLLCAVYLPLLCVVLLALVGGYPRQTMAPPVELAGTAHPELTAARIIEQMAKVYRTCASYADTGAYRDGNGSGTFTTAFVRPDRFRFEYESTFFAIFPERYLVWRDGGQAMYRSKGLLTNDGERMSLGDAVASATGVTYGTAHVIPALLLPEEVGGLTLGELSGLRRLPDAMLDGSRCYQITGEWANETTTVWIDQRTFLVRRIAGRDTVTSYQPVLILNSKTTDDSLRSDW
jgi:outer membrane lipoprotein-sorting protein